MKLVRCDGRELVVYEVSDAPVYRLAAVHCLIKALVREFAKAQADDT